MGRESGRKRFSPHTAPPPVPSFPCPFSARRRTGCTGSTTAFSPDSPTGALVASIIITPSGFAFGIRTVALFIRSEEGCEDRERDQPEEGLRKQPENKPRTVAVTKAQKDAKIIAERATAPVLWGLLRFYIMIVADYERKKQRL